MLFITYLRLCFFVVKEIKSHIWFFSFQHNSSYSLVVLVGIVVLLVDFLSSEHAPTQLTQDYTESLNNSCKKQQTSAVQGLYRPFYLLKKGRLCSQPFFCNTRKWKSKKLNILVKAAQCKIWQILTPDFLQKMSSRLLVLHLLKPKKVVKSHARCLRGLLNVLAFALLLSDLNCQEPRDGGGCAGPTQHGA